MLDIGRGHINEEAVDIVNTDVCNGRMDFVRMHK